MSALYCSALSLTIISRLSLPPSLCVALCFLLGCGLGVKKCDAPLGAISREIMMLKHTICAEIVQKAENVYRISAGPLGIRF